ncbi:hypothetical protein Acor_56540 [Acrocarpospora corrugata]|uniref:Uncharacterized protein n=1 Tax=Acrocarpospora corrugata TaxID=35763 RepID=A0A5M3WAR9_9ACTN|nr:hypothetical protein [Acrocarpospora corrugata]GES03588.1 hypothetical protein Acor_56540 [Acrocarpospora corrugata]
MRKPPARLLIVAAAIALIVTAEAVAVFRLPSPPPAAESEELAEPEVSVEPLKIVLSPAKVQPGSQITVTAPCRGQTATAVSPILTYTPSLDTSTGDGPATGLVDVDSRIPPGIYEMRATCDETGDSGSAMFQVIPPPGGITPGRGLAAVTRVTLTTPARDEVEAAYRAYSLELENETYVKVAVTHEWRLRADDPDAALLRAGAALDTPTDFLTIRLGEVDTYTGGQDLPVEYEMPVLRVDPDSGQFVVTATGVGYGLSGGIGARICRVAFWPPAPDGSVSRPATHEIIVAAPGLTLWGVTGAAPSAQDRENLRFDGTQVTRVAFGTGTPGSGAAAAYLAGDASGYVFSNPTEATDGPWWVTTAAFNALAVLVIAVLVWTFARSFGAAWWRRWDNRFLVLWFLVFYLVGLGFSPPPPLELPLIGLLLTGLPVLALIMAARRVGPPPWPGSTIGLLSIAGGLIGAVLIGSGLLLLSIAPWWWAVLPAAAVGVTAFRRARPYAPVLAAILLGTGILLTIRVGLEGLAPGYEAMTLIMGLELMVLLVAGLAVATGRWPGRAILWSGAALTLIIGVGLATASSHFFSGYTVPAEFYLYSGSVGIIALIYLILLAVLLLIRLRRLGQSAAAVFQGEAYSTMLLGLFLPQVANDIAAPATVVIMWLAVLWLLSGPSAQRAKTSPEITPERHQTLIRALVNRRFARAALTDLLRQGRSRIAAGEMSMAIFEKQRRTLLRASDDATGPIDSDLALSTAGGRTPWQGAVTAFGVGLVLSIPFTTARLVQSTAPDELPGVLATASIAPLLCAVFGFFYPRVRGDQPLTKSMFLLLAAVVITIPAHLFALAVTLTADPAAFSTPLPTPAEAIIGALLAMGNLAVVCLGLGLFWEWRLLNLAAEPWVRVRSVRSARAIAAPLTAVLIAAGTAVTTAFVNNAIAPLPTISEVKPTPTQAP